jgi:hypothetical protein
VEGERGEKEEGGRGWVVENVDFDFRFFKF